MEQPHEVNKELKLNMHAMLILATRYTNQFDAKYILSSIINTFSAYEK